MNQPILSSFSLPVSSELPGLFPLWKQLDFSSFPPARFGFSLTLNPVNEVALLFGGLSSTLGWLNDLWMTDGFGWTQFQTSHSPDPRDGASLIYDTARREAVLFGGFNGYILFGDTWVFDGVEWILKNPSHSPIPRVDACMAYDRDRNLMILFGGLGDTGGNDWEALDDMWVWDGMDWQQQFPTHRPSARFGANMAYDPSRHMMILFGGGVGGGLLNDTWFWDGNDWIEQQPLHRPPVRANFGMTYDENKQALVIYGGQGGPYNLTDTWQWDDIDWLQIPTMQQPPDRLSYRASLVYLPAYQTVMLLNDYRVKHIDIDSHMVFSEHLEAWLLRYQYLNFLPDIFH